MTIQYALAFLREARRDEALRSALERNDDLGWDDLVAIGADAGFAFSRDELQQAHALDWQMRWARYSPAPAKLRDDSHLSG